MTEKFTAWITKYALTSGITEAEATLVQPGMISYEGKYFVTHYAHGGDWHTCKIDAILRAKDMREKKIASLKKQITKLEKMKF